MLNHISVAFVAALAAVGVQASGPRHGQHYRYARQLGNTTATTVTSTAEQLVSSSILKPLCHVYLSAPRLPALSRLHLSLPLPAVRLP